MSDYSEYYEFYKKHWEKALSEKTEKVNLRITELEAKLSKARESLKFYADEKNYHGYDAIIISDNGDSAREALKEIGE
jgi:hypothetical protein